MQKHKNIYDRFECLDVVIHDDLTVERKNLKHGRPKGKTAKSHRITIRLDDELYQTLQKYCMTKNLTESEAIRRLIEKLKWRYY